jgi:tight adherence protein B
LSVAEVEIDVIAQDLINTILLVSLFVLVFCAWSICVILWMVQYVRRRKQVQKRMGLGERDIERSQVLQLWRDEHWAKQEHAKKRRETLGQRLERLRLNAGWKTSAQVVILAVLGVAALAFAIIVALGYGTWLGLAVSLVVLVMFRSLTRRRIAARVALFDRQFVDSLRIAARALRAGHPLVGAFQSISEEISEPIGPIFGEICQEQALGLDIQESMRRMADTTYNADMKLFATAVNIQMSTGGNLAELMDSLATVMRSRMRLNRKVRVLTASTQLNKQTLIGIPIFLFILLNIMSPEYMQVFYLTWMGRFLLVVTVVSVLLGAWLMEKLSVLRY